MTTLKYGKRSILQKFYRSMITAIQNKRMSTDVPEPVLYEHIGTAGLVTLNRPKSLNIMDYRTWKTLFPRLQECEKNQTHLIIKGAGNNFSAGGNFKSYNDENDSTRNSFSYYLCNGLYLLSRYNIPTITLMDGIAYGSGLALALNGRYRVATDRTKVAMPEARIGWITDSSATYHLPRLSHHLGFYMALTCQRLEGKDVVLAGLATHFVPSARLQELEAKLCSCSAEDIEPILDSFSESPGKFSLAPVTSDIDYCFSAETVEEIIERLLTLNNPWSSKTVEVLHRMCPTMLKVELRALQQGKTSGMKHCIKSEYRVIFRCRGSYNALEGMRTALLDKNSRPKWQPATLAEVTDSMVDRYFDPLPAEEEMRIYDD